jgi:hypothetical protein
MPAGMVGRTFLEDMLIHRSARGDRMLVGADGKLHHVRSTCWRDIVLQEAISRERHNTRPDCILSRFKQKFWLDNARRIEIAEIEQPPHTRFLVKKRVKGIRKAAS